MSRASSGSQTINAGISDVASTLFAIDRYAQWADGISEVSNIVRDENAQIIKATLMIKAGAITDDVTLKYDWSEVPHRLSFELVSGKLLKKMDGVYILEPISLNSTKVTYELSVGVSLFIPKVMIATQERAIITRALLQLKENVERLNS